MTYPRKQSISVHPRPSADRTIKALSLWQPWASCVAVGAKRIETRSWSTKYRGPLLIHAAVKCPAWLEGLPGPHPFSSALRGQKEIPRGALIALADLAECFPTHRVADHARFFQYIGRNNARWTEDELGDFSNGRFAWCFENVWAFKEPIPYKGRQGLFNVPYSVVADQLQSISVHPRPSADRKEG